MSPFSAPVNYVSLPLIVLCLPKLSCYSLNLCLMLQSACCLPLPPPFSQSLSPPPSVSHRFISMSLHVYFLIFSSFLVFLYTYQACLCVLYEGCPSPSYLHPIPFYYTLCAPPPPPPPPPSHQSCCKYINTPFIQCLMDEGTIKTPNPKCRLFKKIDQ